VANENLFKQILDHSHIANPYPLYAEFRKTPVSLQEDGTYIVSTYAEITALLHDPRISSDERKRTRRSNIAAAPQQQSAPHNQQPQEEVVPPFIFLDPPDHDNFRRVVMKQFTSERVEGARARIKQIVDDLIDEHGQSGQIDIVDNVAYPLPVTVICELLGVPREDEGRFHEWADILAAVLDPGQVAGEEEIKRIQQAGKQMREYMSDLLVKLHEQPGDNLLSGIVNDPANPMDERQLISTAVMLLIAGHETTVNLITNSMLTLLRHPAVLEQLHQEPDLVFSLIEEVLRYDPPVHFRTRTTLSDITTAGTTIPKGAPVVLLLASGSHDEARFQHADTFEPTREDNQHLGFGGGIHYCVGAPLARIEAHIALIELSRRLISPRLAVDPPPYRANAALRGPQHLIINFEGLRA
jgi:cytochrome P450